MAKTLPNSNSLNDFGGVKQDYSTQVNYSTDWSADNVNSAFSASAQMTRTATRCWIKIDVDSDGYVSQWDAVWKADTTTAPVIAHPSTGSFTATLPTTVSDPLGNTINVNFKSVQVSLDGNGSFISGLVQAKVSGNVIYIYTADLSGTLTDLSNTFIHVWVI